MSTRALLLSSSRVHGGGYLDHAEAEIKSHLTGVSRILFVPYALQDRDGYANTARTKFVAMGVELDSIHQPTIRSGRWSKAQAIFIGGGNTFRPSKTLYELDLLDTIRQRAESGMPYMGASAGSNVAGLTIRTTNDMPIVQPPSFNALGLVPFQINPHTRHDSSSTHMGGRAAERLHGTSKRTRSRWWRFGRQRCCTLRTEW